MMWLTLRRAVVTGAVLLTVVATGCSGDDEPDRPGGGDASTGAASGSDTTAPVETVVTLGNLGKGVGDAKRERIKTSLVAALDPWFDGAWLGEFPRSDYAPAFAAFTPGAARDAQRDLALLSNQAISDRIDTATATRRKVRLDVFSHDGHPRGGTVQFLLDFDTTGTLAESRRVTGRLYVTRSEGQWQVFGYDVDEAVAQ
ncbi:hypothetical protein [Nocardioides flavescens]|uniref:Mce-associated membrane protein n=1 Tax=Nocardioides flavescens TaxID=2691959 RepID=A0A6L7F3B9_9ACTN|nr:hypothetical protein [Nocardioides flavescens]MXG91722.1 hypothetical protein [Nocardioides flavescens]